MTRSEVKEIMFVIGNEYKDLSRNKIKEWKLKLILGFSH